MYLMGTEQTIAIVVILVFLALPFIGNAMKL